MSVGRLRDTAPHARRDLRDDAGRGPFATPATRRPGRGRTVGLAIVFLWFFVGGIAHFALTDAEMKIVPPYIPWHRAAVLVSGVFELIGAAGLLWPPTRRLAGWLLFLVTIAVTPVHVWMLETASDWPVPYWALVARLPLQALLLCLILWSTHAPRSPDASRR